MPQIKTTTPVTFHYRQLTRAEGLWISIPHTAPAGNDGERHMRQGVLGGFFSGEPRCAVSDTGFFFGLDAGGKEMTRDEAVKIGLAEEEEVHA